MAENNYQITEKAQYVNLLLLKDELQYFDEVLSEAAVDIGVWLKKLRATRSVFLTLNNVKDAADRIHIVRDVNFSTKTRRLRKNLCFANHFRNRGIGHLNDTLLKRAVQWSPQLFCERLRDNEIFQLVEAQRTIIESCINSFIDKDGVQKIFGTEIDLMYPPDAKKFFAYLSETVNETIGWLSEALSIIVNGIDHHSDEEVQELAVIAGQTNFDLNAEANLNFSAEEMKARFSEAMAELERHGVESKILEFLRERTKM